MRDLVSIISATLVAGSALAFECSCDGPATGVEAPKTGDGLAVISAFAFPSAAGADVGVAYVTIANGGPDDDRLVSAESSVAREVELHATIEEDGMVRMVHQAAGYPIVAGETLTMKPGGNHIMLMSIRSALIDGQTMQMTLNFEKGGSRKINIPISEDGFAQPCSWSISD